MKYRLAIALLSVLMLPGCGKSAKDEWADIDYAKIARENYRRENDPVYVPPNVIGCTDDDLYNCPVVRPYYH